ncbi:MAG: hypothetical protein KDB00_01395 [Planctomycetales bacterium]|nr:hypothetical protein [Planctomycetales bacterium]
MRCLVGVVFAVCCLNLPTGDHRLVAQERRAVDDQGRIVDFQRDIVPIFRARCLECHNKDEAKADFQIDDPDSVLAYIEAEDVESSALFVDYLLSDDPDVLMPPPKKGGPLAPHELAMVRLWIQEGASWPEDVTIEKAGETSSEPTTPEPAAVAPETLVDRAWAFQGFLHPATVHFPIALLLFGAFFVVVGWKWPALGHQIPMACLVAGALMAIASTAMGWSFAAEKGYGSWTKVDMDSEVFWHRWSGLIVAVTSSVLAVIALRGARKQNPANDRIWKVGLLVVAAMVGAVGHQGGEMTYGKDFYPRAFRILLGTEGEVVDSQEATKEQPSETEEPESGPEKAVAAI